MRMGKKEKIKIHKLTRNEKDDPSSTNPMNLEHLLSTTTVSGSGLIGLISLASSLLTSSSTSSCCLSPIRRADEKAAAAAAEIVILDPWSEMLSAWLSLHRTPLADVDPDDKDDDECSDWFFLLKETIVRRAAIASTEITVANSRPLPCHEDWMRNDSDEIPEARDAESVMDPCEGCLEQEFPVE